MEKKKLIIFIACGVVAMALVAIVLVGLISGQWPWQNNKWADDYTGAPSQSADATGDTTDPDESVEDTTGATGSAEEPTVGVEVEDPNSGNSGNGGNSGSFGGKSEIDYDDLIGAGNGNTEPTSGKDATEPEQSKPDESKPNENEPEATEPESTEPEATTPGTTAPDNDVDEGGGAVPNPGDIDVPL